LAKAGERRRLRRFRGSGLLRGEGFRQTEVENFRLFVRPDLDIGRFQIAMDDTLAVRGFEAFGNRSK